MARRAQPTPPPFPGITDAAAAVEVRPTGSLRPHPRQALLPGLDRDGWRGFVADVAERGLQVPLEINADDVVLDGHLRLRAALELGLEAVPVRPVTPPDEVEYLLRAALQRRQLSASQRAALAVELEQYRQAHDGARSRRLGNLKGQAPAEVAALPPRGKSRDRAASWAGVSPRTIQKRRHSPGGRPGTLPAGQSRRDPGRPGGTASAATPARC